MYTISAVMSFVWGHQITALTCALLCYGFGFLCVGGVTYMQKKGSNIRFPYWVLSYCFGADFTFGFICMPQWLEIGWWFWILLAVGNMIYVIIEFVLLRTTVNQQRQLIFGPYNAGKPVSKRDAWLLCIGGYVAGTIVFATLRVLIGDPMNFFQFMITNALTNIFIPLSMRSIGHYESGMKFTSITTFLSGAFAFLPPGIGYYTTLVPAFNQPAFYILGILSLCFAAYGIYIAWIKFPRMEQAKTTQTSF